MNKPPLRLLKTVAINIQRSRAEQNLSPLDEQRLLIAASQYIHQKGLDIPSNIVNSGEKYYLKKGNYWSMDALTNQKKLDDWNGTELYPWNPLDDRIFWCQRLASDVRMTGRLDSNGTYYVVRASSEDNRHHPIRGHEVVLASEKQEVTESLDILDINRAAYIQIKNFMVDRFARIYPWDAEGDKSSDDIRQEWETKIRARKGLAKMIEEDRAKLGNFDNGESFVMRMNLHEHTFPWSDLSTMLDFTPPSL